MFPIIGGFLAIIALFFPTSFHSEPGYTYYIWISQIYLDVEPTLEIGLLRTDLTLVVFSTIFSVIIYTSAIISMILPIIYRRQPIIPKGYKRNAIILAILIALSTLAWIIMMEIFYRINGYPHWSIGGGGYTPHFGVIGQFIGSVLIVMGVLLQRNNK
jgi:hypothetical protein